MVDVEVARALRRTYVITVLARATAAPLGQLGSRSDHPAHPGAAAAFGIGYVREA